MIFMFAPLPMINGYGKPIMSPDSFALAFIIHPSTQMIINDDDHLLITVTTDLKLLFPVNLYWQG